MGTLEPVWFLVGVFGLVAALAWARVASALATGGVDAPRVRTSLGHAAAATVLAVGLASLLLIAPTLAALVS